MSQRSIIPLAVRTGALLLLWLLISWLVAETVVGSRIRAEIEEETAALDKLADGTAESVDLGLDYLHGIPSLVADNSIAAAGLARAAEPPQARTGQGGASRDPVLAGLDAYLARVGKHLSADVVWIMDTSGNCIASSNADKPESFVGTNYADRDYFRAAREGKRGEQYAMGRKTDIPGLFFSAPIVLHGHFAGVAAAKIDLSKLSHWVNQSDTFISDSYGVIILAHDPALVMRSLPGAAIAHMTTPDRLARYKQTDFPPLSITPWQPQRFPSLRQFDRDDQPLILTSRFVADEALEVHAFKRIPAATGFRQEQLKLFLLLATSGTLALLLFTGVALFARIRKRAAIRAAESASLLRAALEATADGILVVDNDRRVTAYNQRFAEIWHIPAQLVAAREDEAVLELALDQVDDRQAFLDKVLDLYAHPEQTSFDTLSLKDGTTIERYSSPQRVGEQIVGRVWSFRDVTERDRANRALRESRDELENKVQARTADLQAANLALLTEKKAQEKLIKELANAHNQLLQSEKMASIGQLAAGVAHEINNPVGFVYSNLETLQHYLTDLKTLLAAYERAEAAMPPDVRNTVAAIKERIELPFLVGDMDSLTAESIEGLERVTRIVRDLRDFSHVGEPERQWADIERGLESTLNVVRNELKYKADVVKEFAGIPKIECIPTQINQVFMNLLMNAAQAIEEHGTITLRTGLEGDEVWVEVADTGCGIAPENLKRIFDPFFTTKPVGSGTGLGLSLSYGIVRKHHGRIDVASEPGKGSVFRVWLPVRSAQGRDAP